MQTDTDIIKQTSAWIQEVVVGSNFCPFAARELKLGSIHYEVIRSGDINTCLQALSLEFQRLDGDETVETTLLIFPDHFGDFYRYLELTDFAEKFLVDQGKEGVYQVASFHPEYLFAGSTSIDAANYTNRSLFPMLHLLREASLTSALAKFPHPEKIPGNNITYARKKGLEYMRALRESCRI
ncbi:MAG: DUF1415 domain-containing protein [Chitinophagaceae bacterium]